MRIREAGIRVYRYRGDKIESTNVFGRKFPVGFPSRTDWLDIGSVLPSNRVTFYTDGSLLNGRAGAGVCSESKNTGEANSLGTYTTVFQSRVLRALPQLAVTGSNNLYVL
jgi:hypothetical protein